MEKLKVGGIIEADNMTILITSRTDINGTTWLLCVIPTRQQFVSYRVEDGQLCGALHYCCTAFHMAYEEYLTRF